MFSTRSFSLNIYRSIVVTDTLHMHPVILTEIRHGLPRPLSFFFKLRGFSVLLPCIRKVNDLQLHTLYDRALPCVDYNIQLSRKKVVLSIFLFRIVPSEMLRAIIKTHSSCAIFEKKSNMYKKNAEKYGY
jgi:hypothetical protein